MAVMYCDLHSPLTWNMNFGFNTCLSHDETCLAGAAEDGGSRGSAGGCIHSQGILLAVKVTCPLYQTRWMIDGFASLDLGNLKYGPNGSEVYVQVLEMMLSTVDSQDIGWVHVIFKQQSRTSCCFWYHFKTHCRCAVRDPESFQRFAYFWRSGFTLCSFHRGRYRWYRCILHLKQTCSF